MKIGPIVKFGIFLLEGVATTFIVKFGQNCENGPFCEILSIFFWRGGGGITFIVKFDHAVELVEIQLDSDRIAC